MNNLAPRRVDKMNCNPVSKGASRIAKSDIRSLLRFSAHIDRAPLLVHASSGNTSLKRNGTLWIKASGKWLANADQEEILCRLWGSNLI